MTIKGVLIHIIVRGNIGEGHDGLWFELCGIIYFKKFQFKAKQVKKNHSLATQDAEPANGNRFSHPPPSPSKSCLGETRGWRKAELEKKLYSPSSVRSYQILLYWTGKRKHLSTCGKKMTLTSYFLC
jgi:hypothetical protein